MMYKTITHFFIHLCLLKKSYSIRPLGTGFEALVYQNWADVQVFPKSSWQTAPLFCLCDGVWLFLPLCIIVVISGSEGTKSLLVLPQSVASLSLFPQILCPCFSAQQAFPQTTVLLCLGFSGASL